MNPASFYSRVLLVALGSVLVGAPLAAMSADNVGARVVVPLVVHTPSQRTTVYVENHEPGPVTAWLYYVGERSSSSPGRRTCAGPLVLTPSSVLQIDVATLCLLNGPDDVGTLTILSKKGPVIARVSAFARVEVVGQPLMGFSVEGIPMAYLEGNNSVHVVAGLRNGRSLTGFGRYRTDCFVASFSDAYATGQWAKITLKNRDGVPIGSPVSFSMRPWELVMVPDVFTKAGTTTAYEQARAEIALSGGNAATLGYCSITNVTHPLGPATTFHVAKVVQPELETRRRGVNVSATPVTTPAGGTFEFLPGTAGVVHGIYVRHPDKLTCSVSRMELALTVRAPDRILTFGGTNNTVPEFDTGERGAIASRSLGPGWADLWGLELTWNPAFPAPTSPVPYSLACQSGNGVSLTNQIFRN